VFDVVRNRQGDRENTSYVVVASRGRFDRGYRRYFEKEYRKAHNKEERRTTLESEGERGRQEEDFLGEGAGASLIPKQVPRNQPGGFSAEQTRRNCRSGMGVGIH